MRYRTTAERLTVPSGLFPGRWFWRVRALSENGVAEETSATWQVRVQPVSGRAGARSVPPFDFDGDGFGDLAAIVFSRQSNGSRLIVFWGGPQGLKEAASTSTDVPFLAPIGTTLPGQADLANVGDVNGDGFSDLAISAPSRRPSPCGSGMVADGVGWLFVFHGGPERSLGRPPAKLAGDEAGEKFGARISGAGDINGDGYDDVVVSSSGGMAPRFSCELRNDPFGSPPPIASRVSVLFGGGSGLSAKRSLLFTDGLGCTSRWGAIVGDLNGDYRADVYAGCEAEAARGEIHLSGPEGTTATVLPTRGDPFPSPSDQVLAVDTDGDGRDELVVVPSDGRAPIDRYAVGSGVPAQLRLVQSLNSHRQGRRRGLVGDVNCDGLGDLVVIEQSGTKQRAYAYLGSYSGGLSATSGEIELPADSSRNGTPAFIGDFNGDGCADVVVASVDVGEGGTLYVFTGSPAGLASTPSRAVSWSH
jgi:hypothetical protein